MCVCVWCGGKTGADRICDISVIYDSYKFQIQFLYGVILFFCQILQLSMSSLLLFDEWRCPILKCGTLSLDSVFCWFIHCFCSDNMIIADDTPDNAVKISFFFVISYVDARICSVYVVSLICFWCVSGLFVNTFKLWMSSRLCDGIVPRKSLKKYQSGRFCR